MGSNPIGSTIIRTFPQEVANVIQQELLPRLKKRGISIQDSPVSNEDLAYLVSLKHDGKIDHRELRRIFDAMFDEEFPAFVRRMTEGHYEQA